MRPQQARLIADGLREWVDYQVLLTLLGAQNSSEFWNHAILNLPAGFS